MVKRLSGRLIWLDRERERVEQKDNISIKIHRQGERREKDRQESKAQGARKEKCPGGPCWLSAWVSHITQVGCDAAPHPPRSQLWCGHCRFGKARGPAGGPINRARDSWSPAPFLPLKSKEGAQGPPPTCPGGLEDGVEALEPGMRGFGLHGSCVPGACHLKCINKLIK